jgi:hypothetical protein
MGKQYFIEIGGKPIDYHEIILLENPTPKISPVGRVSFVVKRDSDNLKELDLKDRVRVYNAQKNVLMGYVDEVLYGKSFLTFICEGYIREFSSTRFSIEMLPVSQTDKKILFKAFWFVMRFFNEPENIKMDQSMVEDANFVMRDYAVIMPINNLKVNKTL